MGAHVAQDHCEQIMARGLPDDIVTNAYTRRAEGHCIMSDSTPVWDANLGGLQSMDGAF